MATQHTGWTIDDTRLWIHEVCLKLEAYNYWLSEMTEWCSVRDIEDDKTVFVMSMLTILWVSYKLGEPISRYQIFEILEHPALEEMEKIEDRVLYLPPKYGEIALPELLELALHKHID